MRWLLCAAVWLLVNAAALLVAAQTKFGPTLLVVSSRHGVHLGDVLAVVIGLLVASTVTVALWATAPERPPSQVVVTWVLVAAVWELCLVAALFVAAATDIGPVVVTLGRHQVHLGDLVVVVGGVAVAALVTVVAARAAPISRTGQDPLRSDQQNCE